MEIVPQCVGAPRVAREPDRRVTLSFEKNPLTLRMSAQEAIELGEKLAQAGRAALS